MCMVLNLIKPGHILFWPQLAVLEHQFTVQQIGPVFTISVISRVVVEMVHLVVAVREMLRGLMMKLKFTLVADIMGHSTPSILRMLSSGWVVMCRAK